MKRFRNILCVVERADACKPALERAVALAETNGARLTVVDVVEGDPESAAIESRQSALKRLVDHYGNASPHRNQSVVRHPL